MTIKQNIFFNIKKTLDFLKKYKWSSYHDHIDKNRREYKILDLDKFPKYFKDIKDFNKEILTWLKYNKN